MNPLRITGSRPSQRQQLSSGCYMSCYDCDSAARVVAAHRFGMRIKNIKRRNDAVEQIQSMCYVYRTDPKHVLRVQQEAEHTSADMSEVSHVHVLGVSYVCLGCLMCTYACMGCLICISGVSHMHVWGVSCAFLGCLICTSRSGHHSRTRL